jgi:hypothetical protein
MTPEHERTRPMDDHDVAEQAVLCLLLDAHPALRSVDEIVRELTDDSRQFADRDRIENAIRELVRAGLAQREGRFVLAARAAVRADELRF